MGLSVGPQSFGPLTGKLRAADGQPEDSRTTSPLDPLVAALGRAVERSAKGSRHKDTGEGQD
jgi:hypothetical protein